MALNSEDIVKYKSLYLQTSWGYLNMLNKNVAFLKNGSGNKEAVEASHLAAHSLKSQSSMMGYDHIGKFSGLIEEIFKSAKENVSILDGDLLEVILSGLKKIHISLMQIAENGSEVNMEDEIEKLENYNKKVQSI